MPDPKDPVSAINSIVFLYTHIEHTLKIVFN